MVKSMFVEKYPFDCWRQKQLPKAVGRDEGSPLRNPSQEVGAPAQRSSSRSQVLLRKAGGEAWWSPAIATARPGAPNPPATSHYWAVAHLELGHASSGQTCMQVQLHLHRWQACMKLHLHEGQVPACKAPFGTSPSSQPPLVHQARKARPPSSGFSLFQSGDRPSGTSKFRQGPCGSL